MLLISILALVPAHASEDEKSKWLSAKLYGNDNAYAALRRVSIVEYTDDGPSYVVTIDNPLGFKCKLSFDAAGKPSQLAECASTTDPE